MTPDAQAIFATLRSAIVRTGWSETARRCGIDRTILHRGFPKRHRERRTSLATVAAVADALGFELRAVERPRTTPGRDLGYAPDGDGGYG